MKNFGFSTARFRGSTATTTSTEALGELRGDCSTVVEATCALTNSLLVFLYFLCICECWDCVKDDTENLGLYREDAKFGDGEGQENQGGNHLTHA